MKGAKINKKELELLGEIISLTNSLKPSPKGCNSPKTPTTLGPWRL